MIAEGSACRYKQMHINLGMMGCQMLPPNKCTPTSAQWANISHQNSISTTVQPFQAGFYSLLRNLGRGQFFFFFVSFRQNGYPDLNSQRIPLVVGSFYSCCKCGGHDILQFFLRTPKSFIRSDWGVLSCLRAEYATK